MSLPPALQGRDIVCVGFADWETDLWTNQHHLMSRLAAGNRVLFVESLGLRRPQLAGRDLRRIVRRLRSGLQPPRQIGAGPAGGGDLHVLSPLVLPLHGNAAAEALNARLLPALVARAARRLGLRRPILWSYVPQAELLLDALDPSLVVYHCVDDISAHERIDTGSFRAAEARFAARADLVLASAPELVRRMRELSGNVLEAPNVADTALFAQALQGGPVDPAIDALPRPRLVFTGAISAVKLDTVLLAELARTRRDWTLALVGPVGLGDPRTDVSELAAEPNVHLLGRRGYEQLPEVLRGADAGLIPYVRSTLTDSIFPMKVYEYLAAGLPVVSTPLPALAGVREVSTAVDAAGFRALLESELAADGPQRPRGALEGGGDSLLGRAAAGDRGGDRTAPPERARAVKDLLIATHTPVLRSGQTMRTYGLARALAAAGDGLTLLYTRFEGDGPDEAFSSIPGIEFHEVRPSRGARRLAVYAAARASGVPVGFARGISPELRARALQLARAPGRGRVIADGPIAAAAIMNVARRRPAVYNAHNFESGFRGELGEAGGGELRRFERRLLSRFAESWMVSEADLAAAAELCPQARLRYVPNVVDVAAIPPPTAAAREPEAVFVASFAYPAEPQRSRVPAG